jgi:hypothetical protein
MSWMNKYEHQVDIRLDGKYYCRIYQHGIPGAIGSTSDFNTKEESIEAAEVLIQAYQAKGDEL